MWLVYYVCKIIPNTLLTMIIPIVINKHRYIDEQTKLRNKQTSRPLYINKLFSKKNNIFKM